MSLDVKFGVSKWLWTSPFTTASVEELFPKITGMGFDAVEIAVENPALFDIKAIKKGLVDYNLKPIICGLQFSKFLPIRQWTIARSRLELPVKV
jgi:D-psicose/D-tagatose/L-ribulose 3-epimerase